MIQARFALLYSLKKKAVRLDMVEVYKVVKRTSNSKQAYSDSYSGFFQWDLIPREYFMIGELTFLSLRTQDLLVKLICSNFLIENMYVHLGIN